MIVVLKRGTTDAQIEELLGAMQRRGLSGRRLEAADKPVIHVIRGSTRRARRLLRMERVQALVPTSGPRVRRVGRHFYPYHFLNWSSGALVLVAGLVLLAGHFPPGLGPPADPSAPPPVDAALPWYFEMPASILSPLPGGLAALLVIAAVAFLFALPLIERRRARRAGAGADTERAP